MDKKFSIKNVKYFTQIDNKFWASTTCYPTSMAMAIQYCLDIIEKDKVRIGCPKAWQLEDYITSLTNSEETKQWMKTEGVKKFGSWITNYIKTPRYVAVVEEYVFNKLMNPVGFKTTFRANLSFSDLAFHLATEQIPAPIHGIFPIILGGGHICCATGYDLNNQTVIIHDPYGNALYDKYKSHTRGEYAEYPYDPYFIKDKKNNYIYAQLITPIR